LLADWNDCLELGHDGETVFVAMQLRYALKTYIEINGMFGNTDEISGQKATSKSSMPVLTSIAGTVSGTSCFPFRWYRIRFKTKRRRKLLAQPAGMVGNQRPCFARKSQSALKAVRERLATDCGVMVCAPPYIKADVAL
jgi:N,N'-diacetylchitobiose phosphorylase